MGRCKPQARISAYFLQKNKFHSTVIHIPPVIVKHPPDFFASARHLVSARQQALVLKSRRAKKLLSKTILILSRWVLHPKGVSQLPFRKIAELMSVVGDKAFEFRSAAELQALFNKLMFGDAVREVVEHDFSVLGHSGNKVAGQSRQSCRRRRTQFAE